jgi:hypothetical protein
MTTNEDFHNADYATYDEGRRRSTPGLMADLLSQVTGLFSSEIRLVRAELSEKVSQGVAGLGLAIGGAVFLIGALNVVLVAAVAALVEAGIAAPFASLIVAAVAGIVGWLLVSKGLGNLKASRLAPSRTTGQLKRDANLVKERVQ